ncbi:MAG: hypothetical protein B7Z53_01155 [Rhodospirillales bacterium 12-71-4]|nr:MAG: hypothetical protein B7Z53_01155 [Rhodospirillales bacterium 12-71-4]
MPALNEFAGRGPLKCKRPFVDFDGNIWLPGDPLQFTTVQSGDPAVFINDVAAVLRLIATDVEQSEVLAQPELYFELPLLEA